MKTEKETETEGVTEAEAEAETKNRVPSAWAVGPPASLSAFTRVSRDTSIPGLVLIFSLSWARHLLYAAYSHLTGAHVM
jgi:hypothetical protein